MVLYNMLNFVTYEGKCKKKIKVLGVAPYPGLSDLLKEISSENPYIEIDIKIADLQEAVPIMKGQSGKV